MNTYTTFFSKTGVFALTVLLTTSIGFAQSIRTKPPKQHRSIIKKLQQITAPIKPELAKFKTNNGDGIEAILLQFNNDGTWEDINRETYKYSEDGSRIVVTGEMFDGDTWVKNDSTIITINLADQVTSIYQNTEEGYYLFQDIYYAEEGTIDSLVIKDNLFGEYEEKIEFKWITQDSIRFYTTYVSDEGYGLVDTDYAVHKNGNYVEYYHEEDYIDRYTYYGVTINDLVRNLFSEFFFVELLNDELYSETSEFVPYYRERLEKEEDLVTTIFFEYYYDEWFENEKYQINYTDTWVSSIDQYFYNESIGWVSDYRKLYTYHSTTANERQAEDPEQFELQQNYPNPFNPTTVINYQLQVSGNISLKVFDVLGRQVAILEEGVKKAGNYQVPFNAATLPSGIYYYRLKTDVGTQTRSMMLIK